MIFPWMPMVFILTEQNFTKAFWLKLQYWNISICRRKKNLPVLQNSGQRTNSATVTNNSLQRSSFAIFIVSDRYWVVKEQANSRITWNLLLMDKEPANWQRENAFKKQGTLIFLSFHVERHPPPASSKQLILVPDCRRKCMQP